MTIQYYMRAYDTSVPCYVNWVVNDQPDSVGTYSGRTISNLSNIIVNRVVQSKVSNFLKPDESLGGNDGYLFHVNAYDWLHSTPPGPPIPVPPNVPVGLAVVRGSTDGVTPNPYAGLLWKESSQEFGFNFINSDGTIGSPINLANVPLVFDIRSYGAKCDGVTDDSTAINAAILACNTAGGGTVYISGTCAIANTILLGSATQPVEAVSIQGPRRSMSTSNACLRWTGASGGTMMIVRNATGAAISDVGFDARNIAAYCLQFNHVIGDVNVCEEWEVNRCFFTNAQTYNVLIGEPDATLSNGDNSTISFNNCMWMLSFIGATTTAHVRHRSANSLCNSFNSCEFYGTQGSGQAPIGGPDGYYPTYAFNISGGFVNTYNCVDAGIPGISFWLSTPTFGDVPGGINIFGHDSQSANFMRADPRATAAPVYPVTLNGVNHEDVTNSGTYSIYWNRTAYTQLVVNGGFFDRGINNQSGGNVVLNGPAWPAARGGQLDGYAQDVWGTWYIDGIAHANLYATNELPVNSPIIGFNNTLSNPKISIDAPSSDVATTNLVIQGQAPYASASVNIEPGNIVLSTPTALGSGTPGTVILENGASPYLEFSTNTANTIGTVILPSGLNQLLLSAASNSSQQIILSSGSDVNLEAASGGTVYSKVNNLTQLATTGTATTVFGKLVSTAGRRITVTSTVANPYNIQSSDEVIAVGAITVATTINLPSTPTTGDVYEIKDSTGIAATHNIIVSGNGNNIDGATTYPLVVNYSALLVCFNGTSWSVL